MKIKLLVSFVFVILLNKVNAQVENALYFDGIDDQVIVPAASTLITGSSQISMSCWIYPENSAPAFPDYDGFCGFRNDTNADFYLVQISASSIEARFRNSAGVYFNIADNGLQLNTWQNYLLTYDGSILSLYRNGQLTGSISANGSISNSSVDFYIGDILYVFTDFYLQGKIDEVSLWNKALTANEADCIFRSYIDPSSFGLRLYYKFNQGIAGGNNSTVNLLLEENGGLTGGLSNFGLTGALSNWVAGHENYTSISDNICSGQTLFFGSQTLTSPGIYFENFTGWSGCDSVVRMDLSPAVDTGINSSGSVLTSTQLGASYQWVDCDNGMAPVTGETSRTFSPHANGNYAVVVTFNGCTDTTACINVTNVGILETDHSESIYVFPNPFKNKIVLKNIQDKSTVRICDMDGKIVYSLGVNNKEDVDLSFLADGLYNLEVLNSGSMIRKLLIKE